MIFSKEWLQENILTTSEVSSLLKISSVQIRNLINKESLKPVLFASSRHFILKEDVADYIEKNPYVGKTREIRDKINVEKLKNEERKELDDFLSSLISMFDAAKKYPIGVHNIKYLINAERLVPVFKKGKTEFFKISDIEGLVGDIEDERYITGYKDGYHDCKDSKPQKY